MAQTINSAIFQIELRATLSSGRTGISGTPVVGASLARRSWTDADIAYSFNIAAAAAGNVATLTLASGAVAQTTGTPTISDAGVTHEGLALVTMVRLYALMITCTASDNALTIAGTAGIGAEMYFTGDKLGFEYGAPTGDGNLGTVTFGFDVGSGACDVVVIGRST